MTNEIFTWYWCFLLRNRAKTYTYTIYISAIIYTVNIYLTARFTRRLRRITTEKVIAIYILYYSFVLRRFLIDYIMHIILQCARTGIWRYIYTFRDEFVTGRIFHVKSGPFVRRTAVGLVIVESHDNYECVIFLRLTSDFRHLIANGCPCTVQFSIFFPPDAYTRVARHAHGTAAFFVSFFVRGPTGFSSIWNLTPSSV